MFWQKILLHLGWRESIYIPDYKPSYWKKGLIALAIIVVAAIAIYFAFFNYKPVAGMPNPPGKTTSEHGSDSWSEAPTNIDIGSLTDKADDYEDTWDGMPTDLETIIQKTSMTEYAAMLFLHAQPQVVSADSFERKFAVEGTGELMGLYYNSPYETIEYANGLGAGNVPLDVAPDYIFLKKFEDTTLLNLVYVTAAHEMLHAAWAHWPWNLDNKDDIQNLLAEEYYRNDALRVRMKVYTDAGMGMLTNTDEFYSELHSIVATEFSDISTELENYYRIYFTNRAKLVNYNN